MNIVCLVVFAFLFVSCGGGMDASKFLAERDSIMNVNKRQQKELDDVNSVMNEVAACLDSIAEQERFLYVSEEGVKHPRKRVLENLRAFEELLNRQRKQIATLQDSLYHRNDTSSKYFRIIGFLNKELAEKDATIQTLQKEIASHRKNIVELQDRKTELEKNVSDLEEKEKIHKEALAAQSDMLNECYVKIATKKELQAEGLLSGGFLKKKKVDYSNINKESFMTVDIRSFKKLEIPSKHIKILTAIPESSYQLENTTTGMTLHILDATLFWSVSNYLIIQKN